MGKNIRLYLGLILILVVLVLTLLWAGNEYSSTYAGQTPLYQAISSFQKGDDDWVRHPGLVFRSESGEDTFLQGMDLWAAGDFDGARQLFDKSLIMPRTDAALPVYAYYYINDCILQEEGMGSAAAVTNALDSMARYAPMSNDTHLIWSLVETVIPSPSHYQQGVELLARYLKIARNLELHTNAWLINAIAALEYNSGEYARSLRRFYDVEMMLEGQSQTPEIQAELLFAQEYIASTHFFLGDYETAARLYRQLVADVPDEGEFSHYNCYLNLAHSYIRLGRIDQARQVVQDLQPHLQRMRPEQALEVESAIHETQATIAIEEGNLPEALQHLHQMDAFYRDHDDHLFVNGRQLYLLTRSKYLMEAGQYGEAQEILEDMLAEGQNLQYDMRKEALELLAGAYRATGQTERLLSAYEKRLAAQDKFIETVQRAYLEFSGYYQENNLLRQNNARLRQNNLIAILGIIVVSCILLITSVLLKLLSTKNLTDQLTDVYNRKKLNQLARQYRRNGTPGLFGVVMLDIDHFKLYNDTYGHVAGDLVLRQVAQMLLHSVRSNDYVIRYGGEEFLVLINKVSEEAALSVCQRIHQQLEDLSLPHAASKVADHVTISVGLCYQRDEGAATLSKLIQLADQCLYQSKEAGRNRTTAIEWGAAMASQPE